MMRYQARRFGFGPTSVLTAVVILFFQRINSCRCFMSLNYLRLFRSTAGGTLSHTPRGRQQCQLTNRAHHSIPQEYLNRNATQQYLDEYDSNPMKDPILPNEMMTEENIEFFGAGTLGDIMSDPSSEVEMNCDDQVTQYGAVQIDHKLGQDQDSALDFNITTTRNDVLKITSSGLVTSTGGTLTAQFGQKISNLSPLDRIALTANGNLQRIFSSFYDAPVHVHIDKCVKRVSGLVDNGASGEAVWDRVVHLSVFGQTFCRAASNITVHSVDCIRLVESGEVGLGQLFRYLDKLPTFTILDAGRCESGGLWRRYKLECQELTCDILEEFVPDAWQLQEDLDGR